MSERGWRVTLTALGAAYAVQAVWAAVDPASFTDRVAGFGPYNPHLVRDFAAAAGTFGVGLLLAAHLRRWRTPTLGLATLWNGLHAVSHVVDADRAHPHATGPVEAVALVAASTLLAALTWLSSKEVR